MTTIFDGRREAGAEPTADAPPDARQPTIGQPPAAPPRPAPRPAPRLAPIASTGRASTSSTPLPVHDLPVLESVRGIAALMVVVTHVGFTSGAGVNSAWAGWLSRLDFGVALFFLLSGFLLFRPFVQAACGSRKPVSVRAYIRRRYVRIYPAFLVVLAVNWLLTPRAREASGWLWLQTLFLVQNYPAAFVNQLDGLVQTWSLVVEVSFYLLLPVLAALILGPASSLAAAANRLERQQASEPPEVPDNTPMGTPSSRRAAREAQRPASRQHPLSKGVDGARLAALRPGIALAVMALLGLAWRIGYSASSEGYARQMLWLPAFFDWFAAGMMLAWLRERPRALPEPIRILANMPGVCWSLALAGYWMITTNIGGPYGLAGATTGANITKHLTYLVVATLLLLPAVFGDGRAAWRRGATHPIMTWLGRISFGVFLWHPMLMGVIRRMLRMETFQGGFWLTLTLTMVASLIAATLSWRYVEEPLQRRWRNGFRPWLRRRIRAGSASGSASSNAGTASADPAASSAF